MRRRHCSTKRKDFGMAAVALTVITLSPFESASAETERSPDFAKPEETTQQAIVESFTEMIPSSAVSFEMIWIEEGGFWIGKTEVTWDEFLSYCDFDRDRPEGYDAVSRPSKPLEVRPPHRGWGLGDRPAVSMSKNAAQKYCEWLTLITDREYRLPTEAEWRLAAGNPGETPILERAWARENTTFRTQPVGQLAPNEHGLHDTLGNLWEYCGNPFSDDQPNRAVLRGGSWKSDAADCTPDARLRFDPDWVLDDPNFPPGVWWVPDGEHLGMRVLCPGPPPSEQTEVQVDPDPNTENTDGG